MWVPSGLGLDMGLTLGQAPLPKELEWRLSAVSNGIPLAWRVGIPMSLSPPQPTSLGPDYSVSQGGAQGLAVLPDLECMGTCWEPSLVSLLKGRQKSTNSCAHS